MQEYTSTVQHVGIDWITCSAEEGRRADLLREYGIELMMRHASEGNKVGPWKRGVYVGGGTKHVGVGEWRGRALVEVTGRLADDEWPELVALADKVSRIDVQVSVRQQPYDKMLAIRQWAKSLSRATAEGKRPDYDLYARRGQGSTLYIGEGASRYRARLYERWYKEQIDENKDVWRYEVQARRERAVQTASLAAASGEPTRWMAGFVHQHFARRGVAPIYDAGDVSRPESLPQPQTDDDRSVKWLARSVAPVIRRLSAHGDMSRWQVALGIADTDAQEGTE